MLAVAFGKSTMSRTQVQYRFKRFKEGREDVINDTRPGRPLTSTTDENIKAVKNKILDNHRRITIREVANDVGISFVSCQAIFTDVLGMKRLAAKIVPKFLNFEQKQGSMDKKVCRVLVCSSNFFVCYSKKWIKETLRSFV